MKNRIEKLMESQSNDIYEREIMDLLALAYNKFAMLQPEHPKHIDDFVDAIHKAQYVIIARQYSRKRLGDLLK